MIQSEEELYAQKAIGIVHKQILDWGLKANHGELVQAIHVIQGFIIQHMLERIAPDEFFHKGGGWYDKQETKNE